MHAVSEEHPRKQGLKRIGSHDIRRNEGVSEEHPRKQGLKPGAGAFCGVGVRCLRRTSTKTRIETIARAVYTQVLDGSQKNIHENKD